MKYLFIICLLKCSVSFAQDFPRLTHTWELQHEKDFDTIPCVMIVTNDDTGISPSVGYFNPLRQAENDNRIVFWIRGYRVNKFVWGGWSNDVYFGAHWEHYIYLDEMKNQLRLRVWMVQ